MIARRRPASWYSRYPPQTSRHLGMTRTGSRLIPCCRPGSGTSTIGTSRSTKAGRVRGVALALEQDDCQDPAGSASVVAAQTPTVPPAAARPGRGQACRQQHRHLALACLTDASTSSPADWSSAVAPSTVEVPVPVGSSLPLTNQTRQLRDGAQAVLLEPLPRASQLRAHQRRGVRHPPLLSDRRVGTRLGFPSGKKPPRG
jgi:hypothetical protein